MRKSDGVKANKNKDQNPKRTLNTNLPQELFADLVDYCAVAGQTRNQVLQLALNQYLAIKREEQSFRNQHPSRRIKTKVTVEAIAKKYEPQKKASVLIY